MVEQEMFVQYLAEQGHNVVKSEKKPRRNIQYRDLGMSALRDFNTLKSLMNCAANAVARHDVLEFLSDVVPRTVPFKEVKARAKANGNTQARRAVEPGQTTLDGKTPLVNGNGTNGLGLDGSMDDNVDDDSGMADPSMQLEMEIRGMRTGTGPTEDVNGNGNEDEMDKTVKEDVEMS